MTFNEIDLLYQVQQLYKNYDPDAISAIDLESFDINFKKLLLEHKISIESYHELLLEEMEQKVKEDD